MPTKAGKVHAFRHKNQYSTAQSTKKLRICSSSDLNILTCGVPGALSSSGRGKFSSSSCITCRLVPVTGGKLGT